MVLPQQSLVVHCETIRLFTDRTLPTKAMQCFNRSGFTYGPNFTDIIAARFYLPWIYLRTELYGNNRCNVLVVLDLLTDRTLRTNELQGFNRSGFSYGLNLTDESNARFQALWIYLRTELHGHNHCKVLLILDLLTDQTLRTQSLQRFGRPGFTYGPNFTDKLTASF